MNRTIYIYGLTDASDNVRYVGQSVNPWRRYDEHVDDGTSTAKAQWIQSMIAKGQKPGLVILEKTDKENALYVEMWWITLGHRSGWQLTNTGRPSGKTPQFGDMFVEQLRTNFDQFMIQYDPVFFVSRQHIQQGMKMLRILLGIIVGAFLGWQTYLFESSVVPLIPAVCYGMVLFVVPAHLNFLWATGTFKKDAAKNLTLSGVALVHVLTSIVAIAMAR